MGSDIQVLECMLKGMVPGRFYSVTLANGARREKGIELCNIKSLLNSSIA